MRVSLGFLGERFFFLLVFHFWLLNVNIRYFWLVSSYCELCPSQLLLRDSKLRNTDYVYGVVIFTGKDTKAVRNSTMVPSRRSRVERKMDHVIYLLFSMLVMISLLTSVGFSLLLKTEMVKWWYLRLEDVGNDGSEDILFKPSKILVSGLLQFMRALILYGYLILISLYVSIEVIKVLQATLINKDIEMYDEASGKLVHARTSNLNEELGQVEMILSDKTGTLTCNQMEFRKCSIVGVSYGGDINEIDLEASKGMNANDIEAFQFSTENFQMRNESFERFDFSVAKIGTQMGLELRKNWTFHLSLKE